MLEFCARLDGFPRHVSIHSGGMLITAAPLIDIAPLERATMVDRVVVQYDKRDVETIKLILDLGEPLVNRLLLFDSLSMEFREVKIPRDPSCPLCGDNPTIHELIDYEAFCGAPVTTLG